MRSQDLNDNFDLRCGWHKESEGDAGC